MLKVNSKKTKDGYDTICEIRGRGDCIFNELRTLISRCLSDPELTKLFTFAMDIELKKEEEHD